MDEFLGYLSTCDLTTYYLSDVLLCPDGFELTFDVKYVVIISNIQQNQTAKRLQFDLLPEMIGLI